MRCTRHSRRRWRLGHAVVGAWRALREEREKRRGGVEASVEEQVMRGGVESRHEDDAARRRS
eukprot:3252036-Pleurochrysis_carterae.AAC.2